MALTCGQKLCVVVGDPLKKAYLGHDEMVCVGPQKGSNAGL